MALHATMLTGMSKDRTITGAVDVAMTLTRICASTRHMGGHRRQRETNNREKGWKWAHEKVASIIFAPVPHIKWLIPNEFCVSC